MDRFQLRHSNARKSGGSKVRGEQGAGSQLPSGWLIMEYELKTLKIRTLLV
jgi:hypothetical protein